MLNAYLVVHHTVFVDIDVADVTIDRVEHLEDSGIGGIGGVRHASNRERLHAPQMGIDLFEGEVGGRSARFHHRHRVDGGRDVIRHIGDVGERRRVVVVEIEVGRRFPFLDKLGGEDGTRGVVNRHALHVEGVLEAVLGVVAAQHSVDGRFVAIAETAHVGGIYVLIVVHVFRPVGTDEFLVVARRRHRRRTDETRGIGLHVFLPTS